MTDTLKTDDLKIGDLQIGWTELSSLIDGVHSCADSPCTVHGLSSVSAVAFFAAAYTNSAAGKERARSAFVFPTDADCMSFLRDMKMLSPNTRTLYLPWWGTVPYRPQPLGNGIFGERAATLCAMLDAVPDAKSDEGTDAPVIFVASQRSFQTPLPDPKYLKTLRFSIKCGENNDPALLSERLSALGYFRVPKVSMAGEFSERGEVVDVVLHDGAAFRILFDFDKIEKIRAFDTETQATIGEFSRLTLPPRKEVIWDASLIERLREYFSIIEKYIEKNKTPDDERNIEKFIGALETHLEVLGEEYFYPLVFDKTYTLIDYLKMDSAASEAALFLCSFERLQNVQENLLKEYLGLYHREKQLRPVPRPDSILLDFNTLCETHTRRVMLANFTAETTVASPNSKRAEKSFSITLDPPRSFFGNIVYLKETLADLQNAGWRIVIFAESGLQASRIAELLRDIESNSIKILPEAISAGFAIPETRTLLIAENEIFGRKKYVPKSIRGAKSAIIESFVELTPGDFIVHVNYGIGRFLGIERVKALGNERDYIKLQYADDETIFTPIEQANLVQRYIGNEGNAPALDKIGSKSWQNRKNKVKSSVEDIAQKLIDLYSRRQASRGFPFPKDGEWQTSFEAAFAWQETDDQLTASAEIKADMEKPQPMDRLLCGDVGYGKTEIALRAAFKAVMGGKQVVFLSPTTLLAEQHYETCLERFENFPVKIALLSRMVPKSKQSETLGALLRGEIDIVIGTHRVIQKDVHFKDLGLMIVDEEQRFGVKDKERLKEMKANIDALALSATPIPRTLHMSMLKIRDMSLLATPPQNRKPIETVIAEYSEQMVAQSIRQEAERGGQVFFLHNRVESLDETRIALEKLLPEMSIATAHGRMSPEELDDVFRRFKMGGFHVLVATTIIENGIDIPNVNTIIIDRADMYGVSQLYQLRGRVGRSDRTAHAYLLYPGEKSLSELAMKRLEVISDFTALGSGFKIAMKDLEIRGAGNLLGRDQSGDVYAVGFDLYLKLLQEAIERLSHQDDYSMEEEVLLELDYTGFIPDSYISSAQIKMEIYKKIAALKTQDEIAHMSLELDDRFGHAPDEVASLLSLAEIRVLCKKLSVVSLKEKLGNIYVEFGKVSHIDVTKVLRLISESGGKIRLDAKHPNILLIESGKIPLKEKSEYLRERLELLHGTA